MKIHFVINSLVAGGAERVLILLANYFQKQNNDVSIITFNDPEVFSANSSVHRIKLHGGTIKNHTLRSIFNLAKYYYSAKKRPDVLIPFMTHSNFIGLIVSRIYGIKVICSEHNNHLKKTDFIGSFTIKHLYPFSNALTVLTNFDYKYYKKKGINVFTMPNPCTFEVFREKIRKREKVILSVGDLNRYHHKGFDNLIPLIAPLLKHHKDWKLKLVGGGDLGTILLQNLAIENEIEDQIIFEGYSNRVNEIMRDSEIYMMTSRFEGLPMVLLEAMSQGMAVISYDCKTGPSEIINNNINGLLIDDQNVEAMRKGLNLLIEDSDLREKLAEQGIKSLEKYRIESIYEKYKSIFDNIKSK